MDNRREILRGQLIQLLDRFVEVCQKYDLRYYLAYGAVLGAVRHKGIIPWDDDIDVCLMREDYERLQSLPDSVWGKDMRLTSWRKTPKYHYHFLKVELLTTTVIEQFDPVYVGGVFLDVFPLDTVPEDNKRATEQASNIQQYYNKYYLLNATLPKKSTSFYHLLKNKMRHVIYSHQHFQDKWEIEASKYNGVESDRIVCFHSEEFWHPMNRKWLGEGKMLEFEGKQYRVPSDTDAYLTYLYGDYMTPPPVEEREGHSFLYLNVRERISGKELKRAKKKVKKAVAYHIDIRKEWACIKMKMCK